MPKVLGISLIIFFSLMKVSFAEKKIAFIDIDKIINESEFGKKSYKKIDNDFKNENERLSKIEKSLVSKEQEILKQKNVLSENELNSKILDLKKEISNFQKNRRLINEKFNKMRLDKTNEMVMSLNVILSKYADENDISLVIQKKFIVIAKSGLDITNEIMKIFNKENK
tara:strand:- start:4230 stop:4736 length:507 start_codon:yes stop_codon:yes gene_type:complete